MKDLLKILLAVFALLMLGTLSMALDLGFGGAPQAASLMLGATPTAPLPGATPPARATQGAVPTPSLPPYPLASPAGDLPQPPTPAVWPYPYPLPATDQPPAGQLGGGGLPAPAPLPSP